jgi:phosphate:Na+ symporter
MSATAIFINLLGGIALLLWGVRLVRTGVMRGYGGTLRSWLMNNMRSGPAGFAAGVGITALLQSSTATTLITASIAQRGFVSLPIALAIVLGADVGSTLVVQALSLKIEWLAAALIFVGVAAFLSGGDSRRRDLGRAVLGLGLALLALKLIVANTLPLQSSAALTEVFKALGDEPLLAILIGAALTWLAHSSVAMVLLFASLADTAMLGSTLALSLVIGANLGGTIPTLVATWARKDVGRQIAVGNLLFRLVGAVLVLPFMGTAVSIIETLDPGGHRLVADFHTLFNLVVAAIFLPLAILAAKGLARLVPIGPVSDDPTQPRHLEEASLQSPSLALAAAERETLRMGETIESMLRDCLKVFLTDDRRLAAEISKRDDVLDKLHEAIKVYLTRLMRDGMLQTPEDSRRCAEVIAYTTNLEHIGDIIDKNLVELAEKKIRNLLRFSDEGMIEIRELHEEVLATLKLSLAVFQSGTAQSARRLLEEKVRFRERERAAVDRHFDRLRENRPETVQTSSLHLDIVRDLKRINSHLTAAAYPILEAAGELRSSRLVVTETAPQS